ncbi:RNB domain-containing ribonuclease [Caldichromatium japonicum]|uniref:RNB domain-containing ribonuclease n=1 Tax=Caldichromatium japonicum TaxID=2699430 RepID=A0A6G7VC79_9GAMM|nr:RNB domain-containing ribonuclease [Caldichromatium japonicum]QIK37510.1 RNB domain-containing ribonuclease [Caldichromatium japonicum]
MATDQATPPLDSLVLYKVKPARVIALGDKIEIELEGGETKRVRPKDITLLHPGPVRSFAELAPLQGELDAAWELLEGSETTLRDLAELIFNDYTPASAWATWQRVAEGLAFVGTPDAIQIRPRAVVEREQAERAAKESAERDWRSFLERMQQARLLPEDRVRLAEVERLALGLSEHSRILEALGYPETPEGAHRALIRVGHWPERYNPYPTRCGVAQGDPDLPVPGLGDEERLDLTGLAAYAIDDEGTQDPDDALSIEGDRLWVHVADVAALVSSDSPIEREARARGANLYLPEGIINMLPAPVTEHLGLGLQPISPALSFAIRCDPKGMLQDIEVHRSWVRVTRLSYAEVEGRLDDASFADLRALTERYRARRFAQGASQLNLPEVSLRLDGEGRIQIRPLPPLMSRELVTDAMLMAGEAAARFCLERAIPIPFAVQPPPDNNDPAQDLASMYAKRRSFKPTRLVLEPDRHAGLGIELYTRATSPLRRYSDLLVHQQIRAWLLGRPLLEPTQVLERIAEAELAAANVRRCERLANQHWKLIYLKEHPNWRGEGVVVGLEERRAIMLVPELALEARVRLREGTTLNQSVRLAVNEVDLPDLNVSFRPLS